MRHILDYRVRFNKGKCVALVLNSNDCPKFANGEKVKIESSAIYLGANINTTDNPRLDVNTRLGSCFATLNKLGFFLEEVKLPH